MFGWGKKKDEEVVEAVCSRLRPLFRILEHRLNGFPQGLATDPYLLGYIVGAATIFTQIGAGGQATQSLRGLASLSALQSVFVPLNFTLQQASAAINLMAAHPEGRKGARAANLILGVGAGKTDQDNEPEIISAKKAVAAMPEDIRKMLGGTPQSLLLNELLERLFFVPLEDKFGSRQ